MEVPGRIGSVNIEVGQNFGTLVVGDHNVVQLSGVAASVVVAQSPAQVHRPTEVPGFLDRRVETARVLGALKAGTVLELVGAPRIGKTSLARHAALASSSDFRDGAFLLPPGLAGARDALQSLFEIFYVATPELMPSATRLREYLAAKNALVVIDHGELSARDLPALLDAARGCALLVAGVAPSLGEAASHIELGGLPTDDALALMERVHGAPLTGALAAKALAQCEALKGHPQAVIEAARSLGATVPSEAPLADDERTLLFTLRLFAPRAVPREVIAELSGLPRAADLAAALAARGLLRGDESGFHALEALAQDEQSDERRFAKRADAMLLLGRAAGANPARRRKLLAALPLLWATLAQARERGEWQWLLALGAAWHAPLALGGRWDAWARLLDAHLHAARQLGERAAEAWALHQAGTRELALSQLDAARSLFEQSLAAGGPQVDAALQAATHEQLDLISTLVTLPQASPHIPAPPSPPGPPRAAWLKKGALAGLGSVAVVGGALAWWLLGAPKLEVDVTNVDFEPVALGAAGTPASKPVRLRNSGRRAVALTSVRAEPPFSVDASGCTSTPLARGASCELRVGFAPTARGEAHGALVIAGEGVGVAPVALAGRALAGELAVKSRVDFGAIEVGTPAASRSLVVENRGDAPLRIQPLPDLRAPFALAGDGCRGTPLAPGASCRIELRYRAAAAGRHEATLALSSDEPGGAPRSVALVGEGRAAAIEVAQRELRFDAVEIGQRAMRPLRVRNAGDAPLRLSVSLADAGATPFEVDASDCAAAIVPGQSCQLQVAFAPGSLPRGLRETALKLAAPNLPTQNVRLSGRVAAPVLVLQPLAHDFGTVAWPLGSTAAGLGEQAFIVGNDGDAPLRIERIVATPWEFHVVANDCPAVLPPQRRCRVAVRFVPSEAARVFSGRLLVSAAHVQAAAASLRGATRSSPLPVPVLLSPEADTRRECDSDGRIDVTFRWRVDPVPGESLRFRLNAQGKSTETKSTGALRSFDCPATVKWSVRAIAADGRTSDSESRVLRLVRRPLLPSVEPHFTPPQVKPSATTRPGITTPAATPGIAHPSKTPSELPDVKMLVGICCATTSGPMTRTTKAACSGRWWGPTETPPSTCAVIK